MPQRLLTQQDYDNSKALDTEVQAGTDDSKWISSLKLANWRKWWMGFVSIFTNTTDSTSTDTGAVVINGGLGVAKTLFTKTLKITDLIGVGARIVSVDSTGLTSAPFTVTAPTVTDNVIIGNITLDSNWTDGGSYTGPAIVNGIQNQFYRNGSNNGWLYFMYDATTPFRIPAGGIMHLRGMSGTPSATLGSSAGADAPIINLSVSGTDLGLSITFTTGTNPTVNNNVFTITFARAYSTVIKAVVLQAGNANAIAAVNSMYPSSIGTTSVTVNVLGQLNPSTTYTIHLIIVC